MVGATESLVIVIAPAVVLLSKASTASIFIVFVPSFRLTGITVLPLNQPFETLLILICEFSLVVILISDQIRYLIF
jgi:uncharacterized membrane protein